MNVLLDLDGTLTDPRIGIVESIRHALRQLGEAEPPEERLLTYIGPPLHAAFAELLRTDDRGRIDLAVRAYRERYSNQGIYETSVYAGIPEALRELSLRGARLLVATSKPIAFAKRIIERFDLDSTLDSVWGSELDGTRADKRELIGHIVARTGIDPETTVMVGDRKHDALGATSNGILAAGVLWGYGSEDELRAAGCTILLQTPRDLAKLAI